MKVVILISYFALTFSTEIDTDICNVHVIFRHGRRYPYNKELYPKDPHWQYFSDKAFAQLTEKGKIDSYALGQFLRNRYGDLIPSQYNKKTVLTMSTPTNRTIMTAQLVLAGLFKNSLNYMLSENFDWEQLPYQIQMDPLDINVYLGKSECPAFDSEYNRVINSSDFDKIVKPYADLFKYLTVNSGIDVNDLKTANRLYQMLKIEDSMNLLLPEWTQKIYPDKMHEVASTMMEVISYNNVLRRLNAGRLLRIIIDNVVSYINNNKDEDKPKIHLLSGHDMTIACILSALDVFKAHVPKYNSAVIFELHQEKITKQYLMKMFYLKGVNLDLEQLSIEGCPYVCTFEEFVEAIKLNTMINYEVECYQNT